MAKENTRKVKLLSAFCGPSPWAGAVGDVREGPASEAEAIVQARLGEFADERK